tara:strand:+ start:3251 stop:4417 length:1167 start_codon:yes stop_codon:yes gene_type:complete
VNSLIKKYGNPNAVIFSDNPDTYNVIWGFDEIFKINDKQLFNSNILNDLQKSINQWKKSSNKIGAIGYFAYDAKQLFYPKVKFKINKSSIPIAWFGKPKIIEQVSRTEFHNFYTESCKINKSIDLLEQNQYNDKINIIKKYLKAGDVYQINFTQPIKYKYKGCSSLELFAILSKFSKPNFGGYLDMNSHQVLSLSPENFFKKTNNTISSSPIKGTRTRSSNIDKDQELKKELEKSSKDRAEHVMIVDLIRNDLGKICNFGSVKTNNLFKVYSFETIHHMVSDVTGELNDNTQEIDIFKALFPGGSITGAPKQRSMEIIDEIENYSRGVYTGSMGFISNTGDMNFNIAIRTLTTYKDEITYPVGGGIIWDSDPYDERAEAIHKSKVMNI